MDLKHLISTHTPTPIPPSTYTPITINNTTLHYLSTGTRNPSTPTIVLSHPHLTDLRTFKSLQPLLSTSFHVVSYSRRGFWPNTPIGPDDRDDWTQHTLDLASLITTLNLAPVHLLGNSSGAVIALMLARSHPHLLSSLILEEPPLPYIFLPTLPPSPLDVFKLLVRHPTAFLPILGFGISTIAPTEKACKADPPRKAEALEIFAPGACSAASWERIKDQAKSGDKVGGRMAEVLDNLDNTINLFRYSTFPVVTEGMVGEVRCPVFVVTGGESVGAHRCMNWKIIQCVGGRVKREVVVSGAGHFVHEDCVERVGEEVLRWVGEVEGSKKGGT